MHAPSLRSMLGTGIASFVLLFSAVRENSATPESSDSREMILEELSNVGEHFQLLHEQYRDASPTKLREAVSQWHEQHADRIQELEAALSDIIKDDAARAPQPAVEIAEIPAAASQALRQFLSEQATFGAELRQLQWQLRTASPMQTRAEVRDWHRQNADRLQSNLELAFRAITPAAAFSGEVITVIPSEATPRQRQFLAEEAELLDERFEIEDRYKDASPEVRRAAWSTWHERNAARLQAHLEQALEH